jgi:hypothetical protein
MSADLLAFHECFIKAERERERESEGEKEATHSTSG